MTETMKGIFGGCVISGRNDTRGETFVIMLKQAVRGFGLEAKVTCDNGKYSATYNGLPLAIESVSVKKFGVSE